MINSGLIYINLLSITLSLLLIHINPGPNLLSDCAFIGEFRVVDLEPFIFDVFQVIM